MGSDEFQFTGLFDSIVSDDQNTTQEQPQQYKLLWL